MSNVPGGMQTCFLGDAVFAALIAAWKAARSSVPSLAVAPWLATGSTHELGVARPCSTVARSSRSSSGGGGSAPGSIAQLVTRIMPRTRWYFTLRTLGGSRGFRNLNLNRDEKSYRVTTHRT